MTPLLHKRCHEGSATHYPPPYLYQTIILRHIYIKLTELSELIEVNMWLSLIAMTN